jgi:LCP family protein required for cell wall assembly
VTHAVRRALITVAALLLVLLLAGIATMSWAWTRVEDLTVTGTGADGDTWTTLVVGVDTRAPALEDEAGARSFPDRASVQGERADALALVRRSGDVVRVLTLPRDLLVPLPGNRSTRLALTWLAGPQQTVDSLCAWGVGIDHVVAVDYRALVGLVDAVGGLPVTTTASRRDARAHLDPTGIGRQSLSGEQALAWVRSRQPEELTALGWQPTEPVAQRSVLAMRAARSVAEQAPGRLPWVVAAAPQVAEAVRVDPEFSLGDALTLARASTADAEELDVILTRGPIPYADAGPDTRAQLALFAGAETCTA